MLGRAPSLSVGRQDATLESSRRMDVGGAASAIDDRSWGKRVVHVASWNIAGGQRSAEAPARFSEQDQRAAVMAEICRWHKSYGCDVIALQECEFAEGYEELLQTHEIIAAAEAQASRGFVQVYVRRGLRAERLGMEHGDPCVCVRLLLECSSGKPETLVVVAVHLPCGDASGVRERVVRNAWSKKDSRHEDWMLVGDFNADDAEVDALTKSFRLREARYSGVSWAAPGNRFNVNLRKGVGRRLDRVLFAGHVWAESHLVGQGKIFFEGQELNFSDHYGLLCYVDVCAAYGSRAKQDIVAARVRRASLVSIREQNQQKELVEVQARRQEGRDDQALARKRASEQDREEYQRAQLRGARQRRDRRAQLRLSAFGADTLFGAAVAAQPASGGAVPCSPSAVGIVALNGLEPGSWETVARVPLRGMTRAGNTCYVISVAQVLLRVPAVVEWMTRHNTDGCAQEQTTCVLCALFHTYCQVLDGSCVRRSCLPVLAARRCLVDDEFSDAEQHDIFSFFDAFLHRARSAEIDAGRYSFWGGVQHISPAATHVERLFGFVRETRRRCKACQGPVLSWFASEFVLRVETKEMRGGPLTISELYSASCAAQDQEFRCERCCRNTAHDCQTRVLTAPNVLVVQVVRGRGPRVPVAVEEQLEIPGQPSMVLIGVVYHNGPTIDSGHYTCLCRGPGGRFWFYDDRNPVVRMDQEVAHIKPREVYMVVYGRRDGSGAWQDSDPAVVAGVLDGDEGHDAGDLAAGRSDGTPSGALAAAARSPGIRRLKKKTSAEDVQVVGACSVVGGCGGSSSHVSVLDAGSPVGSTPNRNVRAAAADALEQDAGLDVPHSACAAADVGPTTPLRRRLKRKTSAEEAGAFAAVSPPSRRLRKKTSIVESPPHAIVPARAAATAEASEARLVVAGSGGASSGMSTMLKRRRRRVEQAAVDDVIGAERQGERLHGSAPVGGGLVRNSDPAAIVTGVSNGGDAPSSQEHAAAAGASRVAEHGDNEWRSFPPAVMNADLCLGRTWNGGAGVSVRVGR